MILNITKSARRFGYVIWSQKKEASIKSLLGDKQEVFVIFNGFNIGKKTIDWKYHRVSLGYKFTRSLPESATIFKLAMKNDILEVTATNAD